MSKTDMPEKIWASDGHIEYPRLWELEYDEDGTPYILKSTVDAEREADSKTIAALAEQAHKVFSYYQFGGLRGSPEALIALGDLGVLLESHASQIAEAQEEKE